MSAFRPRPPVSCLMVPAAPARATVRWTCQLAGAKMCWCRACAGPWKCVLECASWACTCVCSRARVHVCCAGAAGRAYSRRKRFARSRAVEPPDVAASARPTAMPCSVHRKFFPHIIYKAAPAGTAVGVAHVLSPQTPHQSHRCQRGVRRQSRHRAGCSGHCSLDRRQATPSHRQLRAGGVELGSRHTPHTVARSHQAARPVATHARRGRTRTKQVTRHGVEHFVAYAQT